MNFIKSFFFLFFFFTILVCNAQNNKIKIDATLNYERKEIKIQQEITYYNTSGITLDTLIFHNWANSYRDKYTPLSKRLIEDYDKSLHFAKATKRGYSTIKAISCNYTPVKWTEINKYPDLLSITLNTPLQANDSIIISFTYLLKVPEDTFTKYGRKGTTYNLRYWYITPAVFDTQWQMTNNLNMDDLYMTPADYSINFTVPEGVKINTDLKIDKNNAPPNSTYLISGENRIDVELNLTLLHDFISFKTTSVNVITNLNGTQLTRQIKKDIISRELAFIEKYLDSFPHNKLLINKISYDKNPIYGLNQLPKILNPFSGVFEWDIKMFKVLTRKYLEKTIIVNQRKDAWILDGIQTYLMIKYVEKYYPDVKAMGKISKIWGIRSYQLAKLNFNDKYTFVNQFAMRKNLDQPLTMQADSLSTFNRKIVNKYKAGIGLMYLEEYLGDSIVFKSIKQFYKKSVGHKTTSHLFKELVYQKTTKDVKWFFGDYLHSKKKVDYTIKKVTKTADSINIIIKNKRNFTVPIILYGIKDKKIQFKKWLTDIDSTKTITIAKGDFTRLSLNYENSFPELNLNNNWKNLHPSLFNRPILFRFLKDIDNPYYNQVFYNLEYDYNFYDGLLLGAVFSNKTIFKKQWIYKITPAYGAKSKQLTGNFTVFYQHLPEDTKVYRFTAGISGSLFHYAPNLSYKSITPYVGIQFKRKSLRDVGGNSLFARYVLINRDTDPSTQTLESDNYQVFNFRYNFSKPDIVSDLRYYVDFQLGKHFSKAAIDFRYRKLTKKNRQYDFRAYFGTFIHNRTTSTYFNFALDKPTDYLFDYNYLGRSEKSGFFSQQIIIAEGGFKSVFKNATANQWIFTTNTSVGVWRWIEIYGDAGFYKNRGIEPIFRYDSGIRFNFVHNFLEVYFPLQSSLGFEPAQPNYSTKIRFVLTISPKKIINFVRRGFF